MKAIKDNFSAGSANYAAFRPESPRELYDFLLKEAGTVGAAWDAGTGSGQAAAVLAAHFPRVYATDVSAEQLAHAVQHPRITYRQERAEQSSLPPESVDLVTVAQAFHWFDFGAFFAEVTRVTRPGALLAVWAYSLLRVDGGVIDELLKDFYQHTVGPYWDAERRHVDQGYRDITVPFPEIETPVFHIRGRWTQAELLGYLRTWSAVKHYQRSEGEDPVTALAEKLQSHWPQTATRDIDFPVFMRLFRVK